MLKTKIELEKVTESICKVEGLRSFWIKWIVW